MREMNMTWQSEYQQKSVTAEEAVKAIKTGDTVAIPIDTAPLALSRALQARQKELEKVTILLRQPRDELGWFAPELESVFHIILDTQVGSADRKVNEKRADYIPYLTSLRFKDAGKLPEYPRKLDAVMIVVSPPDGDGYCSFGPYLSHKGDYARSARRVLAEVDDDPGMNIRTPGDNRIHVSEITFFTKHVPPLPKESSAPKKAKTGPGDAERKIAEYVATLVHDGDTVQLGAGDVTESMFSFGTFDGKKDLGIHSAIITPGLLGLIRRGIVNGNRKSVNPGKSVSGGFRRIVKPEDISFINGNPHFLVRDMAYINDIRVIASHDNLIAINGVLAVDLTGQIAADSLGTRMFGGAGGQVEFVIGSILSNGGHSITVLRSTTRDGKISRITPTLENGTVVSISRTFADYVITEYGIARLWGKSQRERAAALISIAHPDFRDELQKQAKELF